MTTTPPGKSMARLVARAALFLSLALLGPGVSRASIMVALDLPDLVRQAEHIAVVEVIAVHAAWDERHERIYSTIDLNVIENWKAPSSQTAAPSTRLTIVQPGGTVGDISMTVMGLGTFKPGERSLVFLRGPANRAQVVGMTQGKRPLRYESASRHWLVAPPDLRQAKLVHPSSLKGGSPLQSSQPQASQPQSPQPQSSVAVTRATVPLDDLHAQVKKLLGATLP
jgi:hypothetical protein